MVGSSVLHFQIVRKIGTGAMSVVYEALDTKLERSVALKLLLANTDLDSSVQARFLQEARILSKFDHPNVGMIHSLESVAGQPFLVMALYQGETLAARIFNTELDISTIVQFALEIAKALKHAHGHQVLHRDIKPANIFVAKDAYGTEQLKVLDFGLAKLEQHGQKLTKTNHVIGTMLYASPEQLKGLFVSQSDLWAWACVVYEMLTQVAPFAGNSMNEVLHQIITAQPRPLEQIRSDVPDGLVYMVMKCLEKNPDDRIQTAQELVALLEQCLLDIKSASKSAITLPFPLITTVTFPKAKLPVPNSEFIGRETELEQIIETLQMPLTRLVSLVGLGGMGKTRLALEVARQLQDSFRDAAVFVDLTRIEDASFLPNAILNALETHANQDPLGEMLNALTFREMLLVLDNFEHIMPAKTMIAQMLEVAPKLQILLTSRENLGLQAEMIIELGGFPEPTSEPLQLQSSAKIFLSSAKRVKHNFMFQAEDHMAFKRIFKALSGSPLGLGLAGTWTQVLELPEIAQEIENNLMLLETTAPDIPIRQRSFAAVFHSSWQRLSAVEQTALTKLAVFRGGFDKEWAKQVAGADLQILQSLIQKSLISRKNNRYSIHDLIRQFAEQEISEQAQTEAMNALSACCLELSQNYYRFRNSAENSVWIKNLELEYENVRSVLAWAAADKTQRSLGVQLMMCLPAFWSYQGLKQEGLSWCETFFTEEVSLDNQEILRIWVVLAIGLSNFSLAIQKLIAFENINEKLHVPLAVGQYYFLYGRIEFAQGESTMAKTYFEEAIIIFRDLKKLDLLADTLGRLAVIYGKNDELEIAKKYFQEALEINLRTGNLNRKAAVLQDLSIIAREQQDFEKEAALAHDAFEIVKKIGDPSLIAHGLTNLAGRLENTNDFLKAEFYNLEAIKIYFRQNYYRGVANNLWFLGNIRFKLRQFETGVILVSAAHAIFEKIGSKQRPKDWQEIQTKQYAQTGFTSAQIQKLEQQGANLSLEQAINYAIQTMNQDVTNTIDWG
jgi:predicted ATPase/tRNA A-37 threonylcarbamoyl transferase component Bud32